MPRATQPTEEGRKRRAPQGPRKEKPIFLLFQVTDQDGNPIPNAKLNIVLATKNTDAVIDKQAEGGLSLAKIEVAKAKTGSDEVQASTGDDALAA